jgi:hypothetical protein
MLWIRIHAKAYFEREKSMRVFTISVMMLICSISSATAEAVKLSGDEIRDLISGNTAFGRLDGGKYHQWFGPDHVTLRTTEGSTTMRGKWRVDDSSQELQTLWVGEEMWTGRFIMEFGNTFYWVSKVTPPTPFQVQKGKIK